MKRKKTITIIVDRYYPSIGGAQKLVKSVAEGVAEKNFKVNVITKNFKDTQKLEKLNGVNIYRVYSLGRAFFDLFSFMDIIWRKDLREVIKDSDLLHSFGLFSPRVTWALSKLFRKPSMTTMHEAIGKKWFRIEGKVGGLFYYLFEHSIFWFNYDKIIGVSKSTATDIKSQISKNKSEKVTYIYNFLDFDKLIPIRKTKKDRKVRFINFGRPGKTKGIFYLIRSFDKFSKEVPNVELTLILNKDPKKERKKIVDLLNQLNNKNIILSDSVSELELRKKISNADVVVVPSLSEGFGFTAVEGSALGKPVLATN